MGFHILRGGHGKQRAHLGHVDGHAISGGLLDRTFGDAELCIRHGKPLGGRLRPCSSVGTEKEEKSCENETLQSFHGERSSPRHAE
jgi:hypothetical protein